MAKREKTGRIDVEGSSSPLEVSLGALLGKEEAPERTGKELKNDDPGPRQKKGTLPGRVILSRETKGRGGKTVTAVRSGKVSPTTRRVWQSSSAQP